jgi:predicted lipoprotein with Yx(FWY)xxD motif
MRSLVRTTHLGDVMACRFNVQRTSLALVMLVAAGCSKSKGTADSAAAVVVASPNAPPVAVAVPTDVPVELQVAAPPGAGIILTDAAGRAVYVLSGPCTGGDCAKQFTPVPGTATAKAGDTAVKSAMAGSTTGSAGSKQATYNGSPLYYYSGDQAPGDTKGAGVKVGGATAHLIGPSGKTVGK